MTRPYCDPPARVLADTASRSEGLTAAEAARRLAENGPNRLRQPPKDPLLRRFFKQLADPMTLVLLGAALVSGATALWSGESLADVVIILAVVIVNAALGVYQESKAEQAIEALQAMSAATSRVLREGRVTVLPSEELVVGDVVLLEAGDAVPADGRLLESASLKTEEAALTGESVPVTKFAEALELRGSGDIPLGDRKNMVYMGSTVSYGRGTAVVTAAGMDTEMGRIAGALAQAREEQTPLQRRLSRLSKALTWLVLAICAVIFAVGALRAGALSGSVLLDTFLVAVSLAVAAIPEGLAAVVTVVLSMGVTSMSRRGAIIRRLTAVETLGCAQVICSDKTGTLTQNKMTVVRHWGAGEAILARAMALCCDAQYDETAGAAVGEPTECALVNWSAGLGYPSAALRAACPRVAEAPFDAGRKMMTVLCREGDALMQYTKGAPDRVLDRCTARLDESGREVPLTEADRREILSANAAMASDALRVLMCAVKRRDHLPSDTTPQALEQDLCFLGLAGMIDPVRPEVRAAIAQCRRAGIRPIMITGDHVDTASAIARELDILEEGSRAVTGAQLQEMDDDTFRRELPRISVYARVQPEHKTRIVRAWQQAGCVTAMTGDGVNDAPALKAADIGVGMGITGTDVTKNVADMVLTDDNFATIVGAVKEGRRIYANIRKAVQFLLSSNLSEVLCIFTAAMLGFTILEPAHLLWINLVTDCFPALALGGEKAERGIMSRSPRSAREGIFADGLGTAVAYQGVIVAGLTLAAYFIGHFMESGLWEVATSPDGTTMAFLTMSMAEIFHCFNLRSQRDSLFSLHTHNRLLNLAAAASFAATTAVIYVPSLSGAFGFAHISLAEYLLAMGLALCVIPLVEAVKFFQRKAGK